MGTIRFLIIMTVLGGLFLDRMVMTLYLKPDGVEKSPVNISTDSVNEPKPVYVVVVDAGSWGSRLHAFTFHRSPSASDFILDNGFITRTEPGLSAYADNPEQAAGSLAGLIANAKEIIPMSEWSKTLFTLKATAGLRSLPKGQANGILEECKKLIKKSGFLVTDESVSIMEGDDEGIFGWLSLNFLQDRFSLNNSETTFASLDLGGGSAEVTYAINNNNLSPPGNHIQNITAFGRNINVYTNCYSGFGVMSTIKEVLTHGMDKEQLKTQDTIVVHSECINPNSSFEWNYNGQKYLINGPLESSNVTGDHFAKCEQIIDDYVSQIEEKPVGLEEQEVVYGISTYFYVAAEVELIDPDKGGQTTVEAFQQAGEKLCTVHNTKEPLMCLQSTYISILLQKGFGLKPQQKIYLYRYLHGHELDWTLGAAFDLLLKKFTNDEAFTQN